MKSNDRLREAFSICRQINARSGKSYYWATQLFPKEKRLATYALYAFFRLADDIVDNRDVVTVAGRERAQEQLDTYWDSWRAALADGGSNNPVLHAAAHVSQLYEIPSGYSECFLAAMQRDISVTRYRTYTDLYSYMEGSAVAVGVMMSYILGYTDPCAAPYIGGLACGMQLTNFLRDVDEDYRDYNRIYIPMEDLRRFNLTDEDIACRRYSARWRQMMEFQADRARALYADGDKGIALLDADVRRPVKVSSVLYSAILGKLRQKEWNVFSGRAKTTAIEKIVLTLQTAGRI